MSLARTASQTIGPFYNFALLGGADNDLTRRSKGGPQAAGEVVEIKGRVIDGDGAPCACALVEVWQADADGRYGPDRDPNFAGFGRTLTDNDGYYTFTTVLPGPVPGKGNSWQAPHMSMSLHSGGLLKQVNTRLYFPDDDANADDPVLSGIEDDGQRSTLVARAAGEGRYEFDVILQGEGETVFFQL
ncbi:MAG: protocatechuate 3,4-dioxygenase subunit alpha [Rhodospirillaceae bacterium]|nr:protocatechuate 3,4-dioxygenase subunit alpha [Rhodospirillaceae bacterium]MDD9913180.1 protocatechuate 3,4-dioxygenase subunit alpha [Rhodospirillaceae bacterium]MDD9926240.1 protocatechuate 3,4-dioxygenase subunit alpha [Rhodospirillaceae bacterium]